MEPCAHPAIALPLPRTHHRGTTRLTPQVNASKLAFRLLCRRHGAQLCYTPMLPSRSVVTQNRQAFDTCAADQPLIVQLCGDDPDIMARAGVAVQRGCQAVDINFGCPQVCVGAGAGEWVRSHGSTPVRRVGCVRNRKWQGGVTTAHSCLKVRRACAALGLAAPATHAHPSRTPHLVCTRVVAEPELAVRIVAAMHQAMDVPVTCKVRVLPSREDTLALCRAFQDAGCQMLTVHGRTRDLKAERDKGCDWDLIRDIKADLDIPVFANGGIGCLGDVQRCLEVRPTLRPGARRGTQTLTLRLPCVSFPGVVSCLLAVHRV